MKQEILNVLFLCTGNSARSILAEAILNSIGKTKFKAFSAGSRPAGSVNPLTLELLAKNRLPTEGLRSKDWNEFSQPGAPFMHFVFTVCDQAAAEACPVWPGQPMTAHWGVTTRRRFKAAMKISEKPFFGRIRSFTGAFRCSSTCPSTHSTGSLSRRDLTRSAEGNDLDRGFAAVSSTWS